MAEVHLASTTVAQGLNKQLVIKKIHPALARSRQFVAMFVDEAKIALGLNHPNIVQVFDFGQVGQTFYLAMEYVEGCDLLAVVQQATRRGQRPTHGLSAYIVQQIAKGLDYAHRKSDEYGDSLGIVHRDISPQNVLVSWDGAVKIVDFGIAGARTVREEEGVVKGKFAYMAPEQARGERVDRRADIFAAGVVLFELCCGRPLFPGKGRDALERVRAAAIPRPRDLCRDISAELEETILRALAPLPGDRFQTARDLQTALGRFQYHSAQTHEELIDSGSLAQYLAQLLPKPSHRPARPPTAPGSAKARSRQAQTEALTAGESSLVAQEARPAFRERKHVYLIRGVVHGLASVAKRLGEEGAGRLERDFLAVSRDIAFKHQALPQGGDPLLLAVGLPVAGDDDANHAIRVALALIDALDGIGHDVEPELRLSVAIERGVAVVTRKAQGDFDCEIDTATCALADQRARAAAGAEIVVGDSIYKVARVDWNFEPLLGPGSADEVRSHRLLGPKERQQRLRERSAAVDLVGRDLEQKALRDAYRGCTVGGYQTLLIIAGEAGIGKRSLINALAASIPAVDATLFRATARAATSMTPFGIVADFCRDLLGLAEGADPEETQRRIEMLVALLYPDAGESRRVRELIDASCLLFGIRREGARKLEPDELRQKLVTLAVRLEQRFSPDKPMVILGEDVHWADEQSIELCRDLVRVPSSRGLLIVLTSRPEPRVIRLAAEVNAEVIHLHELDDASRLKLVERRFVPGEDIAPLSEKIIARAGGNPLFISEMIDSLADRGILAVEGGDGPAGGLLRWVERAAVFDVPPTVESLLATRIDQLPDDLKFTLLHAAVLGHRVSAADVAALVGHGVEDHLKRLVRRGLLQADGGGFSFCNDVTLTVAYRMLPGDDRSALHRISAERLATGPSYRKGQDDAVIARHLELAGDSEAAAETYLQAAAHAVNVGGSGDAFRQLTRALNLLPPRDHARRYAARLQREEILCRMNKRSAQDRELTALLIEAEATTDPARIAIAHARRVQFFVETGDVEKASAAIPEALERARASANPRVVAEAVRLQSAIARMSGQNALSLERIDRALALIGSERENLEERARILNDRGTTLWKMDRLREAIESYAESLIIYRTLGLPRLEARALNNMGIGFSSLGEMEEALAHFKSSLQIDKRLGDHAQMATKFGNIGQTYAELGALERGERHLSRALALAEDNGAHPHMADIFISLGQVFLYRQKLERALEHFEKGIALARQHHDRYQEIRGLIYSSFGWLAAKREPGEALERAARATRLAEAMPMPVGEIYGLAAQGLAQLASGAMAEAVRLSESAVERLASTEQSGGRGEIFVIHARICQRVGRLDEALGALDRASDDIRGRAARLQDSELRDLFLRSHLALEVSDARQRLAAGTGGGELRGAAEGSQTRPLAAGTGAAISPAAPDADGED